MKTFTFLFILFCTVIFGIMSIDMIQGLVKDFEHTHLLGLVPSILTLCYIGFLFIVGIFALHILYKSKTII